MDKDLKIKELEKELEELKKDKRIAELEREIENIKKWYIYTPQKFNPPIMTYCQNTVPVWIGWYWIC